MKNETNKSAGTKVGSANETGTLAADVRSAMAHGGDVQEAVRKLTLRAMNAHTLDLESLRRTMTAVIQGAREGVQHELEQTAAQTQAARALLSDAVTGLDLALAQFAEASKLAVEEAAGRAQKFSSEDLARARADLESLEALFVETLRVSASAAQGWVADTLRDLGTHAQRNGTSVGTQLKDTLASFTRQMGAVGQTQREVGVQLVHATADLIRQIAAGVLTGLADRVKLKRRPGGKDE